ncbi:MAG: rhodanese-like domain-containing protein [Saprospiraceae bacterium]
MKRKGILVVGLLFAWATAGYGQVESRTYGLMLETLLRHSVPEMDVRQAAKNRSQLIFLDARELREYAVSHIDGAVYVGYDQFDPTQLAALHPHDPIVVYCSVGYRSEKIAEKLLANGFKNVSNLYGGIFEWVNQGYPVVAQKKRTRQVHAYDRTWGVWLRKGEKVYSSR